MPYLNPPLWKHIPHQFGCVLLVTGAELLAGAVNCYRPIRFEANMSASEFVDPHVFKPEIFDFDFSVAQNLPVPQVPGSEQDDVFDAITADGYHKDFTLITLRQYDRTDSAVRFNALPCRMIQFFYPRGGVPDNYDFQ